MIDGILAQYTKIASLDDVATEAAIHCLFDDRNSIGFFRAYKPGNGMGEFDMNAIENEKVVRNITGKTAGDFSMMPAPFSSKQGFQQVDEMYTGLHSHGMTNIDSVKIEIDHLNQWPADTVRNIDFINSMITRLKQYAIAVYIQTNQESWSQIAGDWTPPGTFPALLWWTDVTVNGNGGETPENFDGFKPFGPFEAINFKQFGRNVTLCGMQVNRHVTTD